MNRKSATSTALFVFCSFALLLSSAQAQIQPHTLWETRQVTVQNLKNLGDINGDGFDDLVGGGQSWYSPGRVDFISGLDGTLLRTIPRILPQGGLAVQSPMPATSMATVSTTPWQGRVQPTAPISSLAATAALLYTFIQNPAISVNYGLGVGGVGDVNNDGVPDVAVAGGIVWTNSYFEVFSGANGQLLHTFYSPYPQVPDSLV